MGESRRTEIMSIGYQGSTLITDTEVHNGEWSKVVPYEATVFTTLTDASRNQIASEGGNAIAGESFPALMEITGRFSTITLASGAVIAYK